MRSKGYLIFVDLNKSIYRDIISIGFIDDRPLSSLIMPLFVSLKPHA